MLVDMEKGRKEGGAMASRDQPKRETVLFIGGWKPDSTHVGI